MEFSERVLVLQVGKFKETDLWVRFLSPTRGVLSAFAFGGSRSKRRFVGCLDIFNEVLFRVQATNRGMYLALQEGVLLQGPVRLRSDWSRHGIATNCAKFTQAFGVSPEGATTAYGLLAQTLQLLEEADTLPALLPFFYRMRFAYDQGYALNTETCARCGCGLQSGAAYLLVRDGELVCRSCGGQSTGRVYFLGEEALRALCAAVLAPPRDWPAIVLPPTGRSECARAIEGFIQYHVGLTWEHGRFIRI